MVRLFKPESTATLPPLSHRIRNQYISPSLNICTEMNDNESVLPFHSLISQHVSSKTSQRTKLTNNNKRTNATSPLPQLKRSPNLQQVQLFFMRPRFIQQPPLADALKQAVGTWGIKKGMYISGGVCKKGKRENRHNNRAHKRDMYVVNGGLWEEAKA